MSVTILARAWRRQAVLVAVACGLLCGGARPAAAQNLGVKGGTAVSSIVFSDGFAETTSLAAGLTAGAYTGIGLWWKMSVRAEALFTIERATVEDGPQSQFRYLDVPLLVRRGLPGINGPAGTPVTLEAGAAWRHLLDAREELGGESYSITDGVQGNDVALVVGAEVPLTSKWAVVARYVHGQREIYRRATGQYAGVWRSLHVSAHYALWR